MQDAELYWLPLCTIVSELNCWVRVIYREGTSMQEGWWGQMLTIPTEGYLEASGGPTLIRDIAWVEVSTSRIKGGVAGWPRQMIEVKEEILAMVRQSKFSWELLDNIWSVPGIFEDEAVQVIRIANPFGPDQKLR